MRRLLLSLVLVLVGGPAFADDPKPNSEGEYGGVQPGQPKKPEPGKKAKKPPPKGTLSWVGFESKNGGSEVFFQSVAPFEVSQRVEKDVLVVSFTGVSRLASNTWRPIDTRYFDTAISRVTAKKKGRGIEARINFKDPKTAAQGSMRTATEADGLYYVYLGFPGGAPMVDPKAPQGPNQPAPKTLDMSKPDIEK